MTMNTISEYDDKTYTLIHVFDVVRELEQLSGARFNLPGLWTLVDAVPELLNTSDGDTGRLLTSLVYFWYSLLREGRTLTVHGQALWSGSYPAGAGDFEPSDRVRAWCQRMDRINDQITAKQDHTLKCLLSHKDRSEVLDIMDQNDQEMQAALAGAAP